MFLLLLVDVSVVEDKTRGSDMWSFLIGVCVAIVAVLTIVWLGEDRLVLMPHCYPHYEMYTHTQKYHRLKSGGLLLHHNPDNVNRRVLLLLHGNAGDIDGMYEFAQRFAKDGYSVYLLEYHGYGICGRDQLGNSLRPSTNGLVTDLDEAWEMIPLEKRSTAILAGISMGGGVIGQHLKRRSADGPWPAQIVLLNTFFDFPSIASEKFPIPILNWVVKYAIKTRWNLTLGIQRFEQYTTNKTKSAIVVVATEDDQLIQMHHSKEIIKVAPYRTSYIVLPDGGHNASISFHDPLWTLALLPATLVQKSL
jgi:pimeloyl-ACP methyl ester carboxylesterase